MLLSSSLWQTLCQSSTSWNGTSSAMLLGEIWAQKMVQLQHPPQQLVLHLSTDNWVAFCCYKIFLYWFCFWYKFQILHRTSSQKLAQLWSYTSPLCFSQMCLFLVKRDFSLKLYVFLKLSESTLHTLHISITLSSELWQEREHK